MMKIEGWIKDYDRMTGYYVSHELFAIEYSDSM